MSPSRRPRSPVTPPYAKRSSTRRPRRPSARSRTAERLLPMQGHRRQAQHARRPRAGVADLVQHRARPVARDRVVRVVQPLRGRAAAEAETQVAAAPRQVQGELRSVARVDAEGAVAAVQRTVEELGPVVDDEVLSVRTVAERTLDVRGQVRDDPARGGERLLARHGRTCERGRAGEDHARGQSSGRAPQPSRSNVRTRRCVAPIGIVSERAASAVCTPAARAASSSAITSDTKRISSGGRSRRAAIRR